MPSICPPSAGPGSVALARGGVLNSVLREYRVGKFYSCDRSSCRTAAYSSQLTWPVKFWAPDLQSHPDGSAGQLRSSQPALLRSRQYIRLGFCQPAPYYSEGSKHLVMKLQNSWAGTATTSSSPTSGSVHQNLQRFPGIYSSRSRYRMSVSAALRQKVALHRPSLSGRPRPSSRSNQTRSPSLLRLATLMVSMRLSSSKLMAVLNQSMMLKLLMASSSG